MADTARFHNIINGRAAPATGRRAALLADAGHVRAAGPDVVVPQGARDADVDVPGPGPEADPGPCRPYKALQGLYKALNGL